MGKIVNINDLAVKHVLKHPNDKSDFVRSRMNRKFGRKATNEAIKKAHNTLKVLDPNYVIPREYKIPDHLVSNGITHKFKGRKIELVFFDEYLNYSEEQ